MRIDGSETQPAAIFRDPPEDFGRAQALPVEFFSSLRAGSPVPTHEYRSRTYFRPPGYRETSRAAQALRSRSEISLIAGSKRARAHSASGLDIHTGREGVTITA